MTLSSAALQSYPETSNTIVVYSSDREPKKPLEDVCLKALPNNTRHFVSLSLMRANLHLRNTVQNFENGMYPKVRKFKKDW